MLTLLIPGPGYPGKCLDVYMRPLIEELKELWHVGHPTFDKYTHEMFQMHAMVVGTISDFPAYGTILWPTDEGRRRMADENFVRKYYRARNYGMADEIIFVGHYV